MTAIFLWENKTIIYMQLLFCTVVNILKKLKPSFLKSNPKTVPKINDIEKWKPMFTPQLNFVTVENKSHLNNLLPHDVKYYTYVFCRNFKKKKSRKTILYSYEKFLTMRCAKIGWSLNFTRCAKIGWFLLLVISYCQYQRSEAK